MAKTKARAKTKAKKESAEDRKARWARLGYEQLFVRLRTSVLAVLDEHVEDVRRQQEAAGWVESKYTRTQAVISALEAHLGLKHTEGGVAPAQEQLELPETSASQAKPKRVKAVSA